MTRKHPAQELEEDVLVRTSNMGQGRSDYEAFHTLSPPSTCAKSIRMISLSCIFT